MVNLNVHSFLVFMVLVLNAVSSFAGGESDSYLSPERSRKRARTGEVIRPSTRSMVTPAHGHRNMILQSSPASQSKSDAIYIIFDLVDFSFKDVDFENKKVSVEEFSSKVREIKEAVEKLRELNELHRFHKYIGLVSVKKNLQRNAGLRFSEHAVTCNSKGNSSEKRLCIGLRQNSKALVNTRMKVIASNIHSSQLAAFEAYFIKLFGGLEDLGWNSNTGHLRAKTAFFESKAKVGVAELLAAEEVSRVDSEFGSELSAELSAELDLKSDESAGSDQKRYFFRKRPLKIFRPF